MVARPVAQRVGPIEPRVAGHLTPDLPPRLRRLFKNPTERFWEKLEEKAVGEGPQHPLRSRGERKFYQRRRRMRRTSRESGRFNGPPSPATRRRPIGVGPVAGGLTACRNRPLSRPTADLAASCQVAPHERRRGPAPRESGVLESCKLAGLVAVLKAQLNVLECAESIGPPASYPNAESGAICD
jgi:hypothetical protein